MKIRLGILILLFLAGIPAVLFADDATLTTLNPFKIVGGVIFERSATNTQLTNLTVTGSCTGCGGGGGGGSGNSAWTIGLNKIYNATSTDNVGINSTTPGSTLSVGGNITATGTAFHFGDKLCQASNASLLGVGMEICSSDNSIGGVNLILSNKSNGTSAFADLLLENDITDSLALQNYAVINFNSSLYNDNTFGTAVNVPNQFLFNNAAGPVLIMSSTGTAQSYIDLNTGGAAIANNRVRITSSGTVGIGTTTPIAKLAVVGTAGNNDLFAVSSSTPFSSSTLLVVKANGFVGIGSTTPGTLLTIGDGTCVLAVCGLTFGNGSDLFRSGANSLTTNAGTLRLGGTSGLLLTTSTMTCISGQACTISGNRAAATASNNIVLTQNLASTHTSGSVDVVIITGGLYAPTSGSGVFNGLEVQTNINQRGNTTGITRGVYINPITLNQIDFRDLETAPYTRTLANTTTAISLASGVMLNPYFISTGTTATLKSAAELVLNGAPIASGTNVTITSSSAISILASSTVFSSGAVTNAYGIYDLAPSGATNNYAAVFSGGNVGVGTTTPANILSVASSTGANLLSVLPNGKLNVLNTTHTFPTANSSLVGTVAASFLNSSTTNSTASDQDFPAIYTIPANTIASSTVYRVTLNYMQQTGVSAITHSQYLKLGSTKIVAMQANNQTDSITRSFSQVYYIVGAAPPGASVNVEGDGPYFGWSGGGVWNTLTEPVGGIATNGNLDIVPGVLFSGTGSTEIYTLLSAVVELVNP